jgi:hypothetical protein
MEKKTIDGAEEWLIEGEPDGAGDYLLPRNSNKTRFVKKAAHEYSCAAFS